MRERGGGGRARHWPTRAARAQADPGRGQCRAPRMDKLQHLALVSKVRALVRVCRRRVPRAAQGMPRDYDSGARRPTPRTPVLAPGPPRSA